MQAPPQELLPCMRGTSVNFPATELRTRPRLDFHFAAQHHIFRDRDRELDLSLNTKQSFQRLTNSQKLANFLCNASYLRVIQPV